MYYMRIIRGERDFLMMDRGGGSVLTSFEDFEEMIATASSLVKAGASVILSMPSVAPEVFQAMEEEEK